MQSTLVSRGGPLARAARPLLEHVEARAVGSSDAPLVLARLLDLRGSVELARALGGLRKSSTDEIDGGAGERLSAWARDELAGLRARTERTCERWMTKLPDEAIALEPFVASAKKGRSPREIAAVADLIWAPLADEAMKLLSHAQTQVRALRKEVGPEIAALSPNAARLERIDGLLSRATEAASDQRIARMIPATKIVFGRALGAAMEAMPREADAEARSTWLAGRGLVRDMVRSLERIVMAVVDFESERLDALVLAAGRA